MQIITFVQLFSYLLLLSIWFPEMYRYKPKLDARGCENVKRRPLKTPAGLSTSSGFTSKMSSKTTQTVPETCQELTPNGSSSRLPIGLENDDQNPKNWVGLSPNEILILEPGLIISVAKRVSMS